MKICQGTTQLEEPVVVVAVVAILAGYDAPFRFETSIELLTHHTMVGQQTIVDALVSGKVASWTSFVGHDGSDEALQALVAGVDQNAPWFVFHLILDICIQELSYLQG